MGKIRDLTGEKYNMLTVISFAYIKNFAFWNCICDCGKEVVVAGKNIPSGHTKSCGCLNSTHHMTRTKFYKTWARIKSRCNDKNHPFYHRYGGRGILLYDKWNDFNEFKKDMYASYQEHIEKFGEKETTIDRIDNNEGYYPFNCKWSTWHEQNRNKSQTRLLTCGDKTQCIKDWAEELGINATSIIDRINRGWTIEEAVTIPPFKNGFCKTSILKYKNQNKELFR